MNNEFEIVGFNIMPSNIGTWVNMTKITLFADIHRDPEIEKIWNTTGRFLLRNGPF